MRTRGQLTDSELFETDEFTVDVEWGVNRMFMERNVWVRQGEWIVRADPATGEPYADDGQNTGNHIARLSLTTMSDGTTMLNEGHGDLLAAAPDMRGALLSVLADAGTCISPSIMNVCQEALNKANVNVEIKSC